MELNLQKVLDGSKQLAICSSCCTLCDRDDKFIQSWFLAHVAHQLVTQVWNQWWCYFSVNWWISLDNVLLDIRPMIQDSLILHYWILCKMTPLPHYSNLVGLYGKSLLSYIAGTTLLVWQLCLWRCLFFVFACCQSNRKPSSNGRLWSTGWEHAI